MDHFADEASPVHEEPKDEDGDDDELLFPVRSSPPAPVDDDEDEDSDEVLRPAKKKVKRRKRGANQFLDIEADVDEDDEDDDEAEEGFVQNDDFIAPERRQPRQGDVDPLALDGLDNGGDRGGEYETGDASHRLLDRRRNAAKDREAAELAASYRNRYGKRYDQEDAEDWAPKALLMPGVNDPSIWGIKCKTGRERDLVLSLSRKAAAMAASDGAPIGIISAFQRDSIKGFIYVESTSESSVREATANLIGIYSGAAGGVFLVDIEEMPDLLRTKQKKVDIVVGGWVRIKRGKFAGDLAQIMDLSENGEEVTLKQIPRIDLTPKDSGLQMGSDGKKRKKGAGIPLAFRPPQRFFNPEEIRKIYGHKEVSTRSGGSVVFRGDTYKDGYLEKDVKLNAIVLEGVQPTIDELTRFLGESKTEAGGFDLNQIAEAARKAAKTILQPGDAVEVFEGDQRGLFGVVDSILNDVVIITPSATLDLEGTKVEIQARSVRKKFNAGDHVKVMHGTNMDETGLIVRVKDDVVTFLSDLSMVEVTVFVKDVREAAEVGSGVNVIGQYELYDLVQLDTSTTGVIFKIERDTFRILDQTGAVRSLNPSQIGIKADSRRSVATDRDGYNIEKDDMMKEVHANGRDGRTGRILHIHRSMFAFLHNREITENGGVFVAYARSLVSTAPKGNTGKPKIGTGLNPALFGVAQNNAMDMGVAGKPRRDGRIDRRVAIIRGRHKGHSAFVKDVTGLTARVELHTNSKVITVNLDELKEQQPNGTLIELRERPGFAFGGGSGSGGGPSYGGRSDFGGPNMGGGFGSSSNTAPLGTLGGQTPMPAYGGGRTPAPNYSGGRTPAPNYSGGRTPAPGASGATAWDAGGRTPSYGAAGGSGAWNASARTPARADGSADSWNPSSRTPAHPSMARPAVSDAWNATSRTPFHATSYSSGDGGATPNPSRDGDSRYGRMSASEVTRMAESRGNGMGTAQTPAGDSYDSWSAKTPYETPATPWEHPSASGSAPTPAAYGSSAYSVPTPYGSSVGTPYGQTPGAGAPTPGPYGAPTPAPYGAPTPAAYGAPTPAPYGAPTPAPYGAPTPAAYGAPTPGAYGAPTPGASSYPTGAYGSSVQTPASYPTHSAYGAQGAYAMGTNGPGTVGPGVVAEFSGRQERVVRDWAVVGLRVQFIKSDFQNNRAMDQTGIIELAGSTSVTLRLDSNQEEISGVPLSALQPIRPAKAGDVCYILGDADKGTKVTTQSRDGAEWMVQFAGGKQQKVMDVSLLGIASSFGST